MPARRRRLVVEDEEEADIVRSAKRPLLSGSVKRARLNSPGDEADSPTPDGNSPRESPEAFGSYAVQNGDAVAGNDHRAGEFQPGAIVRVKVTNFITYEKAEFFPGPNLNMVIGPNGTGKSSLVCAICIGLGWAPSHLGRATQLGDFVRHGMKEAFVEIELQGGPDEENHIIKLRIPREGNGKRWWLNNRESNHNTIKALMARFNIQIDNLCQFLPQDKVSEFAALTKVELLNQTLRAAAPQQIIDWHDALKELRQEQKKLQVKNEQDRELLANLETRQQNLQHEVDKLNQRKAIQEKIEKLQKAIIFIEYSTAKSKYTELKQKSKHAKENLRRLESQVEPLLQSVNEKQEYRDKIEAVIKERKKGLLLAERAADHLSTQTEELGRTIAEYEQEIKAVKQSDAARKQRVQKHQAKIRELDIAMAKPKPGFDAKKWNDILRNINTKKKEVVRELNELNTKHNELIVLAKGLREEQAHLKTELGELESQAGRQASRIGTFSPDVQKAWEWVQANQGEFEKEVYGPPLVTCSVKDDRYVDHLETLISNNSFLTITTQTRNDNHKLMKKLKEMRWDGVRYYCVTGQLNHTPMWSAEQLRENGFETWAMDLVEGPDAVLNMLFNGYNRHPMSLQDVSEEQLDKIGRCSKSVSFVAGSTFYTTTYRAEYDQSSTSTKNIMPAKFWTDAPVDTSAQREVQAKIEAIDDKIAHLKNTTVTPIVTRKEELKDEKDKLVKEAEQMSKKKSDEQRAEGEYNALGSKREREKSALQDALNDGDDVVRQIKDLELKWDDDVLKKAQLGFQHKEAVSKIRDHHESVLEAEVMFIEAHSDFEVLKEKNRENMERLGREKEVTKQAHEESMIQKEKATKLLKLVENMMRDANEQGTSDYYSEMANTKTVEDVQNELAAEEAKLQLTHVGNPNAIQDFERRQETLEKLSTDVAATDHQLNRIDRKITTIREQWEPGLDSVVAEISEAFSYNFERIGCQGEVGVLKDEDFNNWAIEIKVKFRSNEPLQILDAQRQSGGERSVSTIFYLMALQSLAKSPFRVVDEINQGMDPRNERKVHERMVEIACQEHTSQYFLITPKLLTGLKYDRRMKILCIASGEYMPEDYKRLDLDAVIANRRAAIAAA
ncbi:hypothetical protein BP5796_01856 [Coleophoma crateriformis]|uniref:Structural maintenance of chromosomes protein 5 n=1 Tax=Coleophoma crateriformis TaxID=565419 RepID=A0A3D8T1K9_9HELO|nr:hypothetical protein BP5796_01856 [Coleophoma crateriformis]